jgi:NAD(P)-dependent dehydrogenase (short-subunit alcohol dehydrogenase family)
MQNKHISGKTVVVTGASRGIGEAASRSFAAHGANIVLLARSSDEIAEIAAEIGENALALTCDIADYSAVADAVQKTKDHFGSLDIFIGSAGMIEPIGHLADTDPDTWGHAIDVNLKGVFNGMRAVLPDMIAQGHGTIITISSGAAHGPVEGWSAYCSSKAGAYMLTRAADKENREKGIRILGLSPGTVATQMQRDIKASGINPVSKLDWSDHIPPEWPAETLVWMCGPEADGYLGDDISLREENIRRAVGLI